MSGAVVVFAVLVAAVAAEAAPPPRDVRVTATALTPARGGWTEVLLVARAGDVPWRGRVALAGQSAKTHVALSVPARGQRIVAVPFWVDPSGAPGVWVDAIAAGSVTGPGDHEDRLLVADGSAVLPSTWRTYEPFDLVVLTPAATARLSRTEAGALDTWVRWGGSAAVVRPGAAPEARVLGGGLTLVAPSVADARAGFERLRRARAADPALALLRRWERARPSTVVPGDSTGRPGGALAVLLGAYVALLGGVAVVAARRPRLRRTSIHVVALVIAAATLATWGVARAGGPRGVDVDETALLVVHPEGRAAHLSAVLRVRAHRRATTRWVTHARAPMLHEVEPRRGVASPLRAIRWDVDAGAWDRAWVVGETAVVRAAGDWPDPGIRVHLRPDGEAWRVENAGPHALRRVVMVLAGGPPRALPDLAPSASAEVDTRPTAQAHDTVPDIAWALPLLGAEVEGRPLLLATLDPPIRVLDVVEGDARVTGDTHVVVPLPRGSGPRP